MNIGSGTGGRWRSVFMTFPAVGAALLPKLACPACWPAYSALLGAVGLGFVNYTPYLQQLTAGFLLLALASLGFHARRRRRYGPFGLGLLAAAVIMAGKFRIGSDAVTYAGVVLLVGASLWNARPRRETGGGSCPACVQRDPG